MKKIILAVAIMVVGMVAVNAQTPQTANEGSINYTFLRQNVDFKVTPVLTVNTDTDSHGVSATYTRYLGGDAKKAGVVGVTAELAANGESNEASLVTLMAGLKAQARNNSFVQPYARVLAGVARQSVNRFNIRDNTDASVAYDVGAGLAINLRKNSRYKVQIGADYVNTGFNGERQESVRLSTGLVF